MIYFGKALAVSEEKRNFADGNIKRKNMARQIRETPILYGNDARRFESRMKNPPKETLEEREMRLSHYQVMLNALKAGETARQNGEVPSCIVKI